MRADISVIVPAYAAAATIVRAAQSVFAQAGVDVELVLCADDGFDYACLLPAELRAGNRMTFCRTPSPASGPSVARNIATAHASADVIACLDADDINHPQRLAKQVDYLDRHPEVAAVGVWGRHIEETSGKTIWVNHTPASPHDVKKAMYANLAIVNSSAMIRTDAFRAVGLYSERYPAAEDYEFFKRLSAKFAIANLPEVLIDVCISRQGISLKRRRRQLLDRFLIQLKYFEWAERGAWLGLLRTLLLFFVPTSLHSRVKSSSRHFYSGVTALFARQRTI